MPRGRVWKVWSAPGRRWPGNRTARCDLSLTIQLSLLKYQNYPAEVAKLADALRSGRSEGSLVWVRIPPSAHK
ncbi:protein of unknown function [Candidatus Promineifilum breve]|uniref:Uncharacterized protein n=1 Tax=Candidatus Promineifilum breve TaxID=1806508 RepID=A0A170PDK5_9CHLR|nr:protein of unknown function [Candidatus Promineifilum breve]